jgi:uncharacterized membrane protein
VAHQADDGTQIDLRTAEQAMAEAKQPTTPLAGPPARPLHPLLASVALGAWVCSLGFDLVSNGAQDPGVYSRGAYWLVLAGVLFGLASATVGLFDVLALPRDSQVFRTGVQHIVAADVAIVVFLASFLLRRHLIFLETPWSLIALSCVGIAALSASAWTGLGLTYRWGVRVLPETEQLAGYERTLVDGPSAAGEPSRSEDIDHDDPSPALGDAPTDDEDVGAATHET